VNASYSGPGDIFGPDLTVLLMYLMLCGEQNWQPPKSDHVHLVARNDALTPVRVASVFADKTTETGGQVPAADDGQTGLLDKSREVVLLDDVSMNDGCSYYEQMHVTAGWIKLGLLYTTDSQVT